MASSLPSRPRWAIFVVFVIALATAANLAVRPVVELPPELELVAGQHHSLSLPRGVVAAVRADGMPASLAVSAAPASSRTYAFASSPLTLEPVQAGRAQLEFRLLGVIPVHSIAVNVSPQTQVMVGGHSIGVVLSSRGVVVTAIVPVRMGWSERSPAREAGIQVGDLVLRADGRAVGDEEDLSSIVQECGQQGRPVRVEAERNGSPFAVDIHPLAVGNGSYRIGLGVRDATAGVGTLTFWDSTSLAFAALGHQVTEPDTGQPVFLEDGHIVKAGVMAIHQGRRGQPGEKVGVFLQERDVLGDIDRNTPYGIMGQLRQPLPNPVFPNPLPVGAASSVHPGPAQILTVVEGQTISVYEAQIQKVWPTRKQEGKGMVIRITDPALRQKTGGIVQGMSGSPVIQDGRLVGAITHVFVNDPLRGYGVLAQWMWEEMRQMATVRSP